MYFAAAPDGRRWPLVERGLADAPTLETLDACFREAFEVGQEFEGLHNSVSLGHAIREGRREIADRAIAAVLAAPAGERLRWILGNDLVFLINNCSLRYHEPENDESRLRYHFDADFIGSQHLAINLWVPLDPVGETSPGLTFLNPDADGRLLIQAWHQRISETADPSRPQIKIRFREDFILSAIEGQVDQPFVTPVLARGDALLFNQFVLHATQEMAPPHAKRRSIEFRVAAAGAIPNFYRNHGRPEEHWSWREGTWSRGD
jgi:hypothetical protein